MFGIYDNPIIFEGVSVTDVSYMATCRFSGLGEHDD